MLRRQLCLCTHGRDHPQYLHWIMDSGFYLYSLSLSFSLFSLLTVTWPALIIIIAVGHHKKAVTEITKAPVDRQLFERARCVGNSNHLVVAGYSQMFLYLRNWATESILNVASKEKKSFEIWGDFTLNTYKLSPGGYFIGWLEYFWDPLGLIVYQ